MEKSRLKVPSAAANSPGKLKFKGSSQAPPQPSQSLSPCLGETRANISFTTLNQENIATDVSSSGTSLAPLEDKLRNNDKTLLANYYVGKGLRSNSSGETVNQHQEREDEIGDSQSNLPGFLPLILALLPAATAILLGDQAGIFVTDGLVLVAVASLVWAIRDAAWNNYCRYRTSGSILLYMMTPLVGAGIMYHSREQLSMGSALVTNLNIFAYTALESVRGLTKISAPHERVRLTQQQQHNHRYELQQQQNHHRQQQNQSGNRTIANSTTESTRIIQLEEQVEALRHQLNSIGRRVVDNESVVNSELYNVWRNIDRVAELNSVGHESSYKHRNLEAGSSTSTESGSSRTREVEPYNDASTSNIDNSAGASNTSNSSLSLAVTTPFRIAYWIASTPARVIGNTSSNSSASSSS